MSAHARIRVFPILLILVAPVLPAAADPGPAPAGYALHRVSDGLATASVSGISQLAFRPGDSSHLYAVRVYSGNVVTRYDYDATTGQLSNPAAVTAVLPIPCGLAFRGTDLYVSLNAANDSRIARFRDLNLDGVYEERVDFVRGVPTGDHQIDQLQIFGATLYAGIGVRKNSARPECENAYTGTLGRIADLDQIDYSSGANYLPSPTEYVNAAPLDGMLRRYAYGLRNPFGLRVDAQGFVWTSDNGASLCTTCSSCGNFGTDTPDLLYRHVPQGAKGEFPPAGYPGGGNATMTRFATMATHAAVTGFAWLAFGADSGKILVTEYGSTDTVNRVGRDIASVDPTTGAVSTYISGFVGPTDIIPDANGLLLIADNAASAVYRLEPASILGVAPGRVSRSGVRIERITPNPSAGAIAIEYSLPAASPVKLHLVDVAGREVGALDCGVRSSGRHVAYMSPESGLAHLPAGLYFCRLESGAGSAVRSFLHTR